MAQTRAYLLTPTARRHLREAKAWSLAKWGEVLTEEYFDALHETAADLAKNYKTFRRREELVARPERPPFTGGQKMSNER